MRRNRLRELALENLARAVNTFEHMTAMFRFKSEGRALRDALGGG